ncbi:hypothetical protein LWF15_01080 [Kineosporia rhizophila]|uniref:hypothetical protein n=1 Tax=Kineosporia rhizophila TaxID=84633 RepID=UPI001E5A86D4|nr:hypothetical protein [Kineosporia rhizophila]MCE0534098.1 hypothetical protein [Kineosporia rhizophila]
MHQLTQDSAVRELAAQLNSGQRTRPAVVVTVPTGRAEPWIKPDRIADELADLADVYLLANAATGWAFTSQMPDGTSVYGGAGRVYPPDIAWVHNPFLSRLHLAYSDEEAEHATTALIESALDAAAACGLIGAPPPTGHAKEVTGEVVGFPTASQVMVNASDGWIAMIRVSTLVPGVDSNQLFSVGMQVKGVLDTESRVLDVRGRLPDPRAQLEQLSEGQYIWARVERVEADRAVLLPCPGAPVTVSVKDVIADAVGDLRDLLTENETVAVRVGPGRDGVTLKLVAFESLSEQAQQRISALPFLPGGPPWLTPPGPAAPPRETPAVRSDPVPSAPPPARIPTPAELYGIPRPPETPPETRAPTPARRVPTPADLFPGVFRRDSTDELQQLRTQLDAARSSLSTLNQSLTDLTARLTDAQHQIRVQESDASQQRMTLKEKDKDLTRLRRELRDAKRSQRSGDFLFLDPEAQFRHDLYEHWVHRVHASEKAERPLLDYSLGPEFLPSLDALEGVSRSKVLDVLVEVLTGRAETMTSRDLHRLRRGLGGNDAPVQREDGAVCWRVSLQNNSPSARRLHYWRSPEGIELSRVVVHDDYEP